MSKPNQNSEEDKTTTTCMGVGATVGGSIAGPIGFAVGSAVGYVVGVVIEESSK